MSETNFASAEDKMFARVEAGMKRRRAAEKRFQWYGRCAVALGLTFLVVLFVSIVSNGYTAFWQTRVTLDVTLDASVIDPQGSRDPEVLRAADYGGLIKATLRDMFPDVTGRRDRFALYGLISNGAAFDLRDRVLANPQLIGTTVSLSVAADDDVDMLMKGHIDRDGAEADRRIKDNQLGWIDQLQADGRLERVFNLDFFANGDSRDPELAGIRGALMGSVFTLVVTLALSFPLAVAAAVYLEEFAPKNRWTDLIEVNINNLAAVPSIVFGLLGLAVFINFFTLPRSAPLVGGLVLTLMTLPTIIIASRASLKSVPPSIREGALGVGASPMQAVMYHVLPLAMPGMLTGTIIGMAQALGETAPLLMIGMVAFIADVPNGVFDPSTVLPVQIYLWADSPERAYVEKTSAAILVLLLFLATMNAVAVLLRRRFERRW
ncbi:MAG: phosphate ABC transporter permease PstA [Rhodocyclaceae bacterium]|nr:phosphate ABC transporter permease PstA [Rhodocyclaceae bacterium]